MYTCNAISIIPVCLPEGNDEYIKVGFPVRICENDDYGRHIRLDNEFEKAVERQKSIYGWKGKVDYVQGAVILSGSLSKEEQAANKYNEKLVGKLTNMTRWEFYNKAH